MTRNLVIVAILLAVVGAVALTLSLIGITVTETAVVNGVTTEASHHHVGNMVPAISAFCLAALAGLAALLARVLPGK